MNKIRRIKNDEENFSCMNFALNSLKKCTEMLGITNILLPLPMIMKI